MKRLSRAPLTWLAVLALVVAGPAAAQIDFSGTATTDLRAFEEVPAIGNPFGNGHFTATIDSAGTSIDWELSYGNMVGNVTQAHIHIAQKSVNGGIVIFLCSNLVNPAPPPGTQACPTKSGTISGTAHAADVLAVSGQQIGAGQLRKVLHMLRNDTAYVNVHTDLSPGGEIRGQLDFDPD